MCIKQHIQKAYNENSIASKTNVYLEHGGKETLGVNVHASLSAQHFLSKNILIFITSQDTDILKKYVHTCAHTHTYGISYFEAK